MDGHLEIFAWQLERLRDACGEIDGFPELPSDEDLILNALALAGSVARENRRKAAIWLSDDREGVDRFCDAIARQKAAAP